MVGIVRDEDAGGRAAAESADGPTAHPYCSPSLSRSQIDWLIAAVADRPDDSPEALLAGLPPV